MKVVSETLSLTIVGGAAFIATSHSSAQQILEGDTRLACEAILCLASSTQPSECSSSIQRYFSIRHKKFSDTLKARNGFLNLCPVSQQTPQMSAWVNSLTHGAGRCDANSLNAVLRQSSGGEFEQVTISDQMPAYCSVYFKHEYTNFQTADVIPKYVGIPLRGGFWVESSDFDMASSQYQQRIRAEDEARRQADMHGG
ncbi:TrbM/KikA/MpfK family conjugal transfer protein [Microcoleus sp. MON1_C5]